MTRLIRLGACLLTAVPLVAIASAATPAATAAAASCSAPAPNFTGLSAVSFSDPVHGITVGARNIGGYLPVVYQTTNGTDWTELIPTCAAGSLAAVSTPDNGHAWIAGFYSNSQNNTTTPLILASADAGASWAAQSAPAGVASLTGIHFINDTDGWAVGATSGGAAAVLHTANGGTTWSALSAPVGLAGIDSLAQVDSSHLEVAGYIPGSGNWQPEIATSADGGSSWTEHALGGPAASHNYALSVSFVNVSDGWVTGLNDHEAFIGRTVDGGVTWTYAPDAPFARYRAVSFADVTHGWVVGTDPSGGGTILASTDGGASWSAQTSPPRGLFAAVTALSAQHAVAVGTLSNFCETFPPSIAVTTDGGTTWTHQLYGRPPLPIGDLAALAFSGSRALSVGTSQCRDGSAISSADSGQTWRSLSIPHGVLSLADVAFPDATHGWTVGTTANGAQSSSPTLLATTDAGVTWTSEQLPAAVSSASLQAISFADGSHGWAVGSVILATVNGGATWTQQTMPAGVSQLHDVHFVSILQGWAVGVDTSTSPNTAVVITTADGGTTWTPEVLPTGMVSAAGVDFVSPSTGWVVGSGASGSAGVIFATINGGALWTQEVTPSGSYGLADVSFSGSLSGWAVGAPTSGSSFSAIILATANGGLSWTLQSAPAGTAALEGIVAQSTTSACASGQSGFIVNHGSDAVIACTTDAGTTWVSTLNPNPPAEIPEAPAAVLLTAVGAGILGACTARRRRFRTKTAAARR